MLESLRVSSFKSLSSLELEQLGRINLIIGKNNAGKTSLLEALYLYFSRASASSLERILLDRDEFVYMPADAARSRYAINSLFAGRRGFEGGGASFGIGPLRAEAGDELTVRLARLKPFPSENSSGRYVEVEDTPELRAQLALAPPAEIVPGLVIGYANQRIRVPLTDVGAARSRLWDVFGRAGVSGLCYLDAGGLPATMLGRILDAITLTEDEERVVSALRIVLPDLDRLGMVESPAGPSGQRLLLAKLRSFAEPIPFKSLGGGLNHLLGVMLGMVQARGSVFLVDEIENGIHHSIQEKLWTLVFTLAQEWDIQVFATTHSLDCLHGFSACAGRMPEVGARVVRLERNGDDVEAVSFDSRELAIVRREMIEVR